MNQIVGFRTWHVDLPKVSVRDWQRVTRFKWHQQGPETDRDWKETQAIARRMREEWDYSKAELRSIWCNGLESAWRNPHRADAECHPNISYSFGWQPLPIKNVAVPHPLPHHCGLWAYNTPERMMAYKALTIATVRGAVLAWGKVQIAPYGMRAQHMRVISLLDEPEHPLYRTDRIGKALGVPAVRLEDLESHALRFGDPVPYVEPLPEAQADGMFTLPMPKVV